MTTHFSSSTPIRPAFVARFGEGRWLALYTSVSLVAFAWLVWAWSAAPVVWITAPSPAMRHIPLAIVPLSGVLLVASVTTPNPTMTQMDGLLNQGSGAAIGVLRVTRHPMLWGIGLWALSHMVANPDVAAWWFFGSLAVLSLGGTLALDRKKARDLPDTFPAFRDATSNVPFVALLTGRQQLVFEHRLFAQVLGGLLMAFIAAVTHPLWFGVAVLPF